MNNKVTTPSLSDRMKDYEDVSRIYLTKRTPVIIRLDQKSASTWTSQLGAFNTIYSSIMGNVLKFAMDNIQGAAFGYTVSDEISIFLRDWDKLNTSAWFDNNLQKLVSVAASIVTAKFNEEVNKQQIPLSNRLAFFDARAFILPKDEVVNYFIYRQHDGIRNSIQMLGQKLYSHNKLKGMKNNEIKEMIEKDFPDETWDMLDPWFKYGMAIRKDEDQITMHCPLFKEDRQYIEDLIYIKSE